MIVGWIVALASASEALPPLACPEAVALPRWVEGIDEAEQHFVGLRADPFADAVEQLMIALPCVTEPVPAPVAARYHVLISLGWYARGDLVQARASMAAARSADPSLSVSTALIPEGHELADWARAAPAGPSVGVPPAELGTRLLFDGTPAEARPVDRPTILQVVDPDGRAVTCYLLPDDVLPDYPHAPDPLVERRRRGWGWLVGGGIGLAGSAVLYGLAHASSAELAGPLPDSFGRDDLLALRTRTNLLVTGSVALGAAGTGGIARFALPPRERAR